MEQKELAMRNYRIFMLSILATTLATTALSAADLSVGASSPAPVSPGGTAAVPINYSAKGAQLVALSFDLLFDKANLTVTADAGPAATAAKKGVQTSELP